MSSVFSVRIDSGTVLRTSLSLLTAHVVLVCFAYAQASQRQHSESIYEPNAANVANAIAKVKAGNFAGADVDMIGRAGAKEAIPALREQFERVVDPLDKAKIAQVLVKLGEANETYWNFLVKLVAPALNSDGPDFMSYDSQGKSSPGPSPAFIAWAKAHNEPANGPSGTAAQNSLYIFPGEIALLAATDDARAVPLLRQALRSPNHMVVAAASQGLAELQDAESVPFIIEACKGAPSEAASLIAESLAYFDGPDAQSAVEAYVPKARAKIIQDRRAQGKKTPFSY